MARRKGISPKLRYCIFARDQFTCQYCGRKAPDVVLHVDHKLPVALGGDNDRENLVTACQECNAGKRDSSPVEPIIRLRWQYEFPTGADEYAAFLSLANTDMSKDRSIVDHYFALLQWFRKRANGREVLLDNIHGYNPELYAEKYKVVN